MASKSMHQQQTYKLNLSSQDCCSCADELTSFFTTLTNSITTVELNLVCTPGLDHYELSWTKNAIHIGGSSNASLYHGIHHAIYLWTKGEKQPIKIIRKASFKERGLLLDMGRKYYSKHFLMRLIDKMAQLEMNTLHLHFSENEGFRIESERFPYVTSEEYLSKDEMREVIYYANKRFIQIIPEIDSPGHLGQFLRTKDEWQLSDNKPGTKGHALNIVNKDAVNAFKSLLKEFMKLFSTSTYFHLGADEFIQFDKIKNYPDLVEASKERYGPLASGLEIYVEYINDLIAFTHDQGFVPRIWNDGFYRADVHCRLPLRQDVEICYWTKWHKGMARLSTFLKNNHNVLNYNDSYFYYVLGEAAGYKYPTRTKISEWQPNIYSGDQKVPNQHAEQSIGNYFAIWSDVPNALTEEEVLIGISDPLAAMQEKVWNTQYLI